jgi:hypothetical protein
MYEHSTKWQLSGMGWSELSASDWFLHNQTLYCPGTDKDKRVCALDTDQDRAAMQHNGCIRPRQLLYGARVVNCTTAGGPAVAAGQTRVPGGAGTVWCCPDSLLPIPTTPEALTREQAENAERQQAAQRGEISSDGSPTTAPKTPSEDEGAVSSDNSYLWVFGVLGVAVFSYIGYKYVTSKNARDNRVSRRSRLSGRRI